MKKRTWCYILKPTAFDMRCDKCWQGDLADGTGKNITWSEYEGMIWCYDCKIDTEGFDGIFSGPIPIQVAYMLGTTFDRVILATGEVQRFNLETKKWDSAEKVKENLSPKKITKRLLKDSTEYKDPYGVILRKAGNRIFGVDENNYVFIKEENAT